MLSNFKHSQLSRRRFLRVFALASSGLFVPRITRAQLGVPPTFLLGGGATGVANGLLTGLVAYWNMDEATGASRLDSTGNGHTLTDTNGNVLQVGGALNFGARNVQTIATNGLTTPGAAFNLGVGKSFTLSGWYQNDGYINSRALVQYYDQVTYGYGINGNQANAGNTIIYVVENGTIAVKSFTFADFSGTGWHHIAFGYDSPSTTFWYQLDGGTRQTQTVNDCGAAVGPPLLTFGQNGLSTAPQQCGVDEIGWWNRSLSTGNVLTLYNGGTPLSFGQFS